MRVLTVVAFLVLVAVGVAFLPAQSTESQPAQTGEEKSCIECHADLQPGLMVQWTGSAHDKAGTKCEDCHGEDHDAMFRAEGRVPSNFCQGCHPDQTLEFKASVHGRALKDALSNARLMAQIPAMRRQGCLGCHDMGGPRGGRCDSCHGAHRFSSADARRPEACGLCHRGPDHPHIEAFEASKHGILWDATHDESVAPTCASCHMPKGTHDASTGITIGRAGSGAVLEGEEPPIPMRRFSRRKSKGSAKS